MIGKTNVCKLASINKMILNRKITIIFNEQVLIDLNSLSQRSHLFWLKFKKLPLIFYKMSTPSQKCSWCIEWKLYTSQNL